MNNPFLKRIMKTNSEEILHSSVYAKAQNPDTMGATSTESFAARMKMENHRQNIRGYKDSRVVNDAKAGLPRAKTYTPDNQQKIGGSGSVGRAQATSTNNVGRTTTPPVRKNPGIFR